MARLDPDVHAALAASAEELDWSTNSALNEAARAWVERRDYDTARLDRPDGPPTVELRPLSEPGNYRVAVDGYLVPYLIAHRAEPPQGTPSTSTDALGWHTLSLDDRYATKAMSWGELWPVCWFLANAMAVAAGYSSHGPNATRTNPHGPPEPLVDLAAWSERGWTASEASGSTGQTFELVFTFNLPAFDGADLRSYELRDQLLHVIEAAGAGSISHRISGLRPLQSEPATT